MSAIEWTDETWNPIVGCSLVSPGCTNCYAMGMAGRLGSMPATPHYAGLTASTKGGPVWTGEVRLAPDHILRKPLCWKRPRMVFVNSMGDLFHEDISDAWIDQVFAVMALSREHTFQVLTKRPERMRAYLSRRPQGAINAAAGPLAGRGDMPEARWPLPNVWLGVSVEDQRRADERIPILLDTPAAVRFVSAEPLLGPVDLTWIAHEESTQRDGVMDALLGRDWVDGRGHGTLQRVWRGAYPDENRQIWRRFVGDPFPGIDWVIAGGESGPDARPMAPGWARALRDQCAAAEVPFFFKQWGGRTSKSGGRLLDGAVHDARPERGAAVRRVISDAAEVER